MGKNKIIGDNTGVETMSVKKNNDDMNTVVAKEENVTLEEEKKELEKEKLELEKRANELKNEEDIWNVKLEALKRQEAQIKENITKEQQKISEEKNSGIL